MIECGMCDVNEAKMWIRVGLVLMLPTTSSLVRCLREEGGQV